MTYSAHLLSPQARAAVLARFPPKFADVICHHVTERFGVPRADKFLPAPARVVIVGHACDASLEALVVTVNGSVARPDGMVYHITLSLDRSAGRKPADANQLIAAQGWSAVEPLPVDTVPAVL